MRWLVLSDFNLEGAQCTWFDAISIALAIGAEL
jgi:hypothetical protein